MMNALRMVNGFEKPLFEARTHLPLSSIQTTLNHLCQKKLITQNNERIRTTALGFRFLNTALTEFDVADTTKHKALKTHASNVTHNHIASDKNQL